MLDERDLAECRGRVLLDVGGSRIGTISEVCLDRGTSRPEWALVETSSEHRTLRLVPLTRAVGRGDVVQVPYPRDVVRGAPAVHSGGVLSPRQEADTYRHYGIEYGWPDAASRGLPVPTAGAGGRVATSAVAT